MTKSEIVEALRCAADLCSRPSPCGRYKLFGSAVGDAAEEYDVSVTGLRMHALDVGVEIVHAMPNADTKVRALLEAAQRIEESE